MIQSNKGKIEKRILYAKAVYGEEEKQAVLKSLENGWLASGPLVKKFEEEVAKLFGKKYGIAVNSGSSANLLAIRAARKLEFGGQRFSPHGIITPACTFSTTVSEILLNECLPMFLDSVIGRYTINEDQLETVNTGNTDGVIVPQLVGGICDMEKLRKFCDKYKLFLIDDSCDTFAPKLKGKTVASYADITTTSFYGSHIITAMGFGGMVMTDREDVKDAVIMMRDWGRYGSDNEDFKTRFNFKRHGIPYDSKFMYGDLGFNLKLNEGGAAFGLEQLKKLPQFLKQRTENFNQYTEYFKKYEKWFYLPYVIEGAETNWLAYPLTIRREAPFKRYDLLQHLEEASIQTRVLFSGNITRHEPYINYFKPFKNADYIMEGGFLIGVHQGLKSKDIEYVTDTFDKFLRKF